MKIWPFLVLFAGCAQPPGDNSDHGWEEIPLEHARCFALGSRGTDHRLTVFGEGGRTDTLGVYIISANASPGTRPPVTRLAVVSTTHLAFVDALGALDRVIAGTQLSRIMDPDLRTRALSSMADVGTGDGFDREKLIALAPEVLCDYPFGRGGSTAPLANVERIAITEYLEEHPLGRAEWIRFFGVLLGERVVADSLYGVISQRYRAAVPIGPMERPVVFFGSTWQRTWYVPPGNSYMARLVHDAGGTYRYAGSRSGGNLTLDAETVIRDLSQADHFGVLLASDRETDALSLVGGDQNLARMQAVQNGGFVGNSARSDLFGKALLEPDVVLRDLVALFHPELVPAHRPVYFFPLAQSGIPIRR